jgi:flagellar biosynthesis/type III secretory pathway ATPase
MGIYTHGANPKLDHVLGKLDDIKHFLQQDADSSFHRDSAFMTLKKICEA